MVFFNMRWQTYSCRQTSLKEACWNRCILSCIAFCVVLIAMLLLLSFKWTWQKFKMLKKIYNYKAQLINHEYIMLQSCVIKKISSKLKYNDLSELYTGFKYNMCTIYIAWVPPTSLSEEVHFRVVQSGLVTRLHNIYNCKSWNSYNYYKGVLYHSFL